MVSWDGPGRGEKSPLPLALVALALQQLALLVLAHLLAPLLDHASHRFPSCSLLLGFLEARSGLDRGLEVA